MKNVLVVGGGSYIGQAFVEYADTSLFNVVNIGARNGEWLNVDFSKFDTVLHCAGIAHVAQKKNMRELYYKVNCDLAVEVAKMAKSAGVGQFVFLSSVAAVKPDINDFYGGSKLKAEGELLSFDGGMAICILRPPMVYGYGCKGNFPRLVKLAKAFPIFPNIQNRRSMIYIDNLCEFISRAILKNKSGIHLPQNAEYVNTTELVQLIAKLYGKKIRTTKVFNPLIRLFAQIIKSLDKLFGNLAFEMSGDEGEYNVVEFVDGVKRSLV